MGTAACQVHLRGLQRRKPSVWLGRGRQESHPGSTYICFQGKYAGSARSGRKELNTSCPFTRIPTVKVKLPHRIGEEKLKCDFFFLKRQDYNGYIFFLCQILPSVNIFRMQLQKQWVGCVGQEVAGGWDSGRNVNEMVCRMVVLPLPGFVFLIDLA